jgi:tetratricopeptide (TPR) repeat protein
MKLRLLIILLVLNLLSSAQQPSFNKKAVELNNKAIQIINGPGEKFKKVNQANLLLDEAIKLDSRYTVAYSNKLQNLISIQNFKRAINVADSLIKIKPYMGVYTAMGLLQQKTGNLKTATLNYNKALTLGLADYFKKPSPTMLCELSNLYFLISGKEKAISFLNSEKEKFRANIQGYTQIEWFAKELPNSTVNKLLGINSDIVDVNPTRKKK